MRTRGPGAASCDTWQNGKAVSLVLTKLLEYTVARSCESPASRPQHCLQLLCHISAPDDPVILGGQAAPWVSKDQTAPRASLRETAAARKAVSQSTPHSSGCLDPRSFTRLWLTLIMSSLRCT